MVVHAFNSIPLEVKASSVSLRQASSTQRILGVSELHIERFTSKKEKKEREKEDEITVSIIFMT